MRTAPDENTNVSSSFPSETGLASIALYQRILTLDPNHAGAKEMIETLTPEKHATRDLIINAVQVSVVIFLALALIFMRLRTPR